MNKAKATIADVAALSGFSTQTVSRVINRHPYVSELTRKKVKDAVKELQYYPNLAARALSNGQTTSIGVVSWDTTLYGPASMLHAVQSAARGFGYSVSFASINKLDRKTVEEAARGLQAAGVDGLILIIPVSIEDNDFLEIFGSAPIVVVESENLPGAPTVGVNQHKGAYEAVEYLIAMGHTNIAHIAGPKNWFDAKQRVQGWRDALKKHKLSTRYLTEGDWSSTSGYEAMEKLLKHEEITAVFAANDATALGALKLLNERKVKVPSQISICGFDDIPDSNYFIPGLTTIRQNFEAVGTKALELLIQKINGEDVPVSHTYIEPLLIERESVYRRK